MLITLDDNELPEAPDQRYSLQGEGIRATFTTGLSVSTLRAVSAAGYPSSARTSHGEARGLVFSLVKLHSCRRHELRVRCGGCGQYVLVCGPATQLPCDGEQLGAP